MRKPPGRLGLGVPAVPKVLSESELRDQLERRAGVYQLKTLGKPVWLEKADHTEGLGNWL